MNADLEKDLAGTDLRSFAASLQSAPQARVSDDFSAEVMSRVHSCARRWFSPEVLLPLAACLVAVCAFAALVFRPVPRFTTMQLVSCQRTDGSFSASSSAPYVQAFAVTVLAREPSANTAALDAAVDALVRTQTADGGWANAPLSARNTAALAAASAAGVARARSAYRKALRYLRINGIDEMSAHDLAQEAKLAAARLGTSNDAGLACSASLCAARL